MFQDSDFASLSRPDAVDSAQEIIAQVAKRLKCLMPR